MAIFGDAHDDSIDIRAKLQRWLSAVAGMGDSKILSLEQASSSNGYSNRTFTLVVRHGDEAACERLILRLPPTGKSLFPDYDLTRQFAFMTLLQDRPGLPMGAVRWIEIDERHLGSPFFVVDHVPGVVPPDNPMYHVAGWVHDATAEERASLWKGTIDALAALSNVRPDAAALARLDWADSDVHRTLQHIDHWTALARWGEHGLPPSNDPTPGLLRLWLIENLPSENPAGVVWGDSRIGNVIYQDFRPAALLDWELACLGDPEIDLAYFLLMQLYHETLRPEEGLATSDPTPQPRLSGFAGDHDTVIHYARMSGRPVRNLRYYWLFNAYKMYCMAQRMAAMQIELGLASMEQAMLIRRLPSLTPHVMELLSASEPNALPSASRWAGAKVARR